jgi:hypothetical protein
MSKDDYFISLLQAISVQKLLEGPSNEKVSSH